MDYLKWFAHLFDKCCVVLSICINNLLHIKLCAMMKPDRVCVMLPLCSYAALKIRLNWNNPPFTQVSPF